MITGMRTASIAPGKTGDALAFSQQILGHLNEKHGATAELLMPVGGNPSRLGWLSRYENLAQYDAFGTKLLADKVFWELTANNGRTFLAGSLHDQIWRQI